jgi:copper resistance protein D
VIAWAAGESASVTLRFLVYLDLLLLAGLTLCARRTVPIGVSARVISALAGTGLLLTVAQFAATALAMAGGDMAMLDRVMLRYLAVETPMGLSSIARFALLALIAVVAISGVRARSTIPLLAVMAVATLAWSGHAGASDGGIGILYRASDIVHLIAASAWLGTLLLLLLAIARLDTPTTDLVASLRRFAGTGTLIVGALILSGIVNLSVIVGLEALPALVATEYGRTLILKLLLFAAMLGFAAYNRWRLTPRLERSADENVRSLRASVSLEAAAAVGVIMIVAFLGTQSPTG